MPEPEGAARAADVLPIVIGTAGWAIPRTAADRFPGAGPHLTRYAGVLAGTEINATFHRRPRRSTFTRWVAETGAGFRFAAKLPRTITHDRRLVDCEALLDDFLGDVGELGARLGPLLVQLPGSLEFERAVADTFFGSLRARHAGTVVCEPRHAGWFTPEAGALLGAHAINRVGADPARVEAAAEPLVARDAGPAALAYWRWHGSPQVYRSSYATEQIERWADAVVETARGGVACWCIFDNTTSGAAAANALDLQAAVVRRLGG
ncbi:DUF72 domain-containing protein [Piscinibacter koreensis]|uniref:DUF72 domain-containing protein n=1 Tax=Piscinibacter koreensis TaxID=2742824 RepID=A0A7Y6NPY9_9BURK|nr:DUF72 domain-containing protein [Schlegelella koreensis]NUZ07155.1 DUF72 domain-containing protein [Schlegelella koreensis]